MSHARLAFPPDRIEIRVPVLQFQSNLADPEFLHRQLRVASVRLACSIDDVRYLTDTNADRLIHIGGNRLHSSSEFVSNGSVESEMPSCIHRWIRYV